MARTSEPTNSERRAAALEGLQAHYETKNGMELDVSKQDIFDEDVIDMLADMMHLCDMLKIDFGQCVRMAETHHDFETE